MMKDPSYKVFPQRLAVGNAVLTIMGPGALPVVVPATGGNASVVKACTKLNVNPMFEHMIGCQVRSPHVSMRSTERWVNKPPQERS